MSRALVSPELANLIAARVSPEEFRRRCDAPLTDAERADIIALRRWFMRRYPTAAERLAYARRKHRALERAVQATPRAPSGPADYLATARRLAAAHRRTDPAIRIVALAPDPDQRSLRLLEVTGSAPTTWQIEAVDFAPRPDLGVPFSLSMLLLSPTEWEAVQGGQLALPDGWDMATLMML